MDKTILIIPDPHDEPGVAQDRFEWAGKLVAEKQPDVVVALGDWGTFDSLSEYDTGSVHAEGRRYSEDVKSFLRSMDIFEAPVNKINEELVRMHKKKYNPRKIFCMGNHEQRILRAVIKEPRLIGTISIEDLELEARGWERYNISQPAEAYGIAFSHYFTSGILGKPISGINHARNLVMKAYTSAVVGHAHTRQFWEDTNVFGQKMIGLVAGCYFTHDLKYTTEGDRAWAGLTLLRLEGNSINPEFIDIKRMCKEYS